MQKEMSVAGYVKRAAADDAWIRSIPHIYRFVYCYSHMLETVQAYACVNHPYPLDRHGS